MSYCPADDQLTCSLPDFFDNSKINRRMTAFAIGPETTRMHVIATMTTPAQLAYFGATFHGTRMARFALHVHMRPVDHKVCLAVVIEIPEYPVRGNVAEDAVRAELLLMDILIAMTVDAFLWSVLEARRLVAILTAGIPV